MTPSDAVITVISNLWSNLYRFLSSLMVLLLFAVFTPITDDEANDTIDGVQS